ncbi:MAG TPA: glutamyl-tRNA reductase [Candidatus Dormibacteraeota bacterium]|nr:glutamyl-tRNA reductase [Candidatus Dormibacteraeota bacterium]
MQIVLIGLNHRTAPVGLRERVAFSKEQARDAAEQLRSRCILEETLILSTCNRSELYGVSHPRIADGAAALQDFLAAYHRLEPSKLDGALYRHRDRDAIRHLYRVAAGLDSMLLGETEILGQVRDAYQAALGHGVTGRVLNRLFQGAIEVGKRVRTETDIAVRPVSVAFAGVKLAEQIFGRLNHHRALILGAGVTSKQVVKHLRDRGIHSLRVLNRTVEHARDLANRFGGEVLPWENLPEAMEWPDLIVTSVSSPEAILTRQLLDRAMATRGNRPLLVIDLGVPRNVAADAANLPNLYLYDIDDLTEIVEQNKKARQGEVPRAEAIIEGQIEKFLQWQAGVAACSVLAELRATPAGERNAFLHKRLASMAHLSEQDRVHADMLLQDFLKNGLLDPDEGLNVMPKMGLKFQNLEALRNLIHANQQKS